MVMLLIDSGNSAIKCRLIKSGNIVDQTFSTYEDESLQGFTQYLTTVRPDEIFLASVSPEAITRKIKQIAFKCLNLDVIQLTTLAELSGLKNGYTNYKKLGVDRWLTLVAAFDPIKSDSIIIDFGSAITIDLLSVTKGHLGGAILPGFNTRRERFEKMFPEVDFEHPEISQTDVPGRTTASCIHITEVPVTIHQIKKLLDKWVYLLEKPVKILLCGQDSNLVGRQLDEDYQIIPDLVFKGMLKQIQLQG